jgi:CheY-like chemotaxis protein
VLLNLLSNAVKFTEGGEVVVLVDAEATAPGSYRVELAVRDTGIGIPADRMDQLFTSFSQVDASTTRRFGGTGLGLTISSRLAAMMGGGIGVESHFGEGSCFRFSALVQPGGEPGLAALEEAVGAGRPARALHVLVAEDNQINQKVVTRLLEKQGHRATLAGNGREAIEKLLVGEFDAILMDVQMPEMNGLEATRAIRRAERGSGRHVPILAMTAHAMKGDREKCLASGMDGYVSKPIRAQELLEALQGLIPVAQPTVPLQ